MSDADHPVIIALDFDDAAKALALVDALGAAAGFYKVGMELYAAEGIAFVRELLARGKRIFLDLKLYDIGETVKRTTAVVARTGVEFLTVHGSSATMRAAVEGRGGSALKLLAVTVLTSFDEQDLRSMGYPCRVEDLIELRVRNAVACGIDGIVCSPVDAARVRATAGPKTLLVTPGVRSQSADTGDQKRIATPEAALAAGANYLVMGRQITRAADPAAELARVLDELGAAVNG